MKKIIVFIVFGVLIASSVPFKTTFIPEMKIRVVDENGYPYRGQTIAQYCTNYTLGIHPCEEVSDAAKQTDEDGFVVFPAREITASLLYRVTRPILGLVLLVANGEYGSNAHLLASGPRGDQRIEFEPGGPYPTQIVLPSSK